MITVYEPITVGVWSCACSSPHCELNGQLYVACNFPPEIADLDRVWAEGPAAATVAWRAEPSALILELSLRRPVRCTFAVRYRRPEHAAVLDQLAHDGYLLVCHQPHRAGLLRIVFWTNGVTLPAERWLERNASI